MQKWIIGGIVAIIFLILIINSGGNTSTTMRALSNGRIRDDISSIVGAVDVIGDGRFKDVEIRGKEFKGVVDQPASAFEGYIEVYHIRDKTAGGMRLTFSSTSEGNFDNGTIGVGGITGATITLAANPRDIRMAELGEPTNTKINGGAITRKYAGNGIPPILKDKGNSKQWLEEFIFTDSGMALDQLIDSSQSGDYNDFNKLKESKTNQLKFLEIVLGNDNTPIWNQYRTDRIVSLKQIDSDALTGVDRNETTLELIDPNRAYLYEVAHVNTSTLNDLASKLTAASILTADTANRITNDLARHLNQTLGGKLIVIPNNDATKVIYEDAPLFVLN